VKWLLCLLLLTACETNEVRAWTSRRVELESRVGELARIEAKGAGQRSLQLGKALDRPAFVREHGLAARVFREPGGARLSVTGSVAECRDAVAGLSGLRWLTESWRLRLEQGRCDWEARTGPGFATLEAALLAPTPKWIPPPAQLLSRGVAPLREAVSLLEADVLAREARLGAGALAEGRAEVVQPLADSLRARPPPCDLAVLERELALDAADQGMLLEVEQSRLVHPLEPRHDFRLRGLVEVQAGGLAWRCEAL
jgi:hypothetical protein